jgi:hypothetical protein
LGRVRCPPDEEKLEEKKQKFILLDQNKHQQKMIQLRFVF